MKDLLEELKELLDKHDAEILITTTLDEDCNTVGYIEIGCNGDCLKLEADDSGSVINSETIEKLLE